MSNQEIEFTVVEGNPVLAVMAMQAQGLEFEVIDMGEVISMKYYVEEGGFEPIRAHFEDAGMDLRTPEDVMIYGHGSAVIPTKVHVEIPVGYYGKLESKSGLNVKHDIVCLGGTIDSGYTGEIMVKLYNMSGKPYKFHAGDKIVQLIIQPCVLEEWVLDPDFKESERGDNGFGSSGK